MLVYCSLENIGKRYYVTCVGCIQKLSNTVCVSGLCASYIHAFSICRYHTIVPHRPTVASPPPVRQKSTCQQRVPSNGPYIFIDTQRFEMVRPRGSIRAKHPRKHPPCLQVERLCIQNRRTSHLPCSMQTTPPFGATVLLTPPKRPPPQSHSNSSSSNNPLTPPPTTYPLLQKPLLLQLKQGVYQINHVRVYPQIVLRAIGIPIWHWHLLHRFHPPPQRAYRVHGNTCRLRDRRAERGLFRGHGWGVLGVGGARGVVHLAEAALAVVLRLRETTPGHIRSAWVWGARGGGGGGEGGG